MYVNLYASFEFTKSKRDRKHCYRYTLHYWHMPISKLTCNMHIYVQSHYCRILHIEPTMLDILLKIQENASFINHVIAVNVQAMHIPLKCHMCATCTHFSPHELLRKLCQYICYKIRHLCTKGQLHAM